MTDDRITMFNAAYDHAIVRGYSEEYAWGYASARVLSNAQLNGFRDSLRDLDEGRELDPAGEKVIVTS